MNTQFKEVAGFPQYLISNDGQVISTKAQHNKSRLKKRKLNRHPKGYLYVTLFHKGKLISKKVHRLVAQAFIPNPKNLPEVNHKNGIKDDNRVENLEWVTTKQNLQHSIDTLKIYRGSPGEKNGRALLSTQDVKEIKKLFKAGMKRSELAKKFKMNWSSINSICKEKSWKHLSKQVS